MSGGVESHESSLPSGRLAESPSLVCVVSLTRCAETERRDLQPRHKRPPVGRRWLSVAMLMKPPASRCQPRQKSPLIFVTAGRLYGAFRKQRLTVLRKVVQSLR